MSVTKNGADRSAAVKRAENARKAKGKTFTKHKPDLGAIDPTLLYPFPIFHEISGLGQNALAQAEKDGMKVLIQGSRKYVLGSDFIEHMRKQNKKTG